MESNLKNICQQAIVVGRQIDLTGCRYYGEPVNQESFSTKEPQTYYYLLAGLVRILHLTNILELGTYYGGSIISMSRGLSEQDIANSRLVSIDVNYKNAEELKKYPNIKRIQGDIISLKVLNEATKSFSRNIDLLFLDAGHSYWHVKTSLYAYANRLRPKYIIIDDIFLNSSIKKMWQELAMHFKGRAYDISEIIDREGKVGIGIIIWDNDFRPNWFGSAAWIYISVCKIHFFNISENKAKNHG